MIKIDNARLNYKILSRIYLFIYLLIQNNNRIVRVLENYKRRLKNMMY